MAGIFKGGIPTGQDVEKVLGLWRKMKAGDVSKHEDIQAVLGVHPRTARYRTVVSSARRKFNEETGGVFMLSVSGVGYQFPTGKDQIKDGQGDFRRIGKRASKATAKIANVADDRLQDQDKVVRDFLVQSAQAVVRFVKAETKKIAMAILPTQVPLITGEGKNR